MKEIKPRLYQKEVIDRIAVARPTSLYWGRRRFTGIDIGSKRDKSFIIQGISSKNGEFSVVYIDELSNVPNYKWYSHPIKWYKFRKLMSNISHKEYIGKWKN